MRSGRWSIPPSCRCRSGFSERSSEPCSVDAIGRTRSGSNVSPVRFIQAWRRNKPAEGRADRAIKESVFYAYGTLYDVQSVASVTDQAFPGYGELITQIWRIKQLEYTWLRSLMGRYKDFWAITQDSLAYTIDCLGLKHDDRILDQIMDKYYHLDLYPEA